jgi:hypothetical protein
MDNIKNIKNNKNIKNKDMQDYAKVMEDITNQLEVIKSVINLDLDLLEKIKQTGKQDDDTLTLYELDRLKNNYINLNLDSLDKINSISKSLNQMQEEV